MARGAALVIDLYFFNGVPISFEARLTGTARRENKLLYHYSTSSTSSIKKIYRLELQRILAKGRPLASHTTTLSPDLKKTAPLSLLTDGHRFTGEEKDVQR